MQCNAGNDKICDITLLLHFQNIYFIKIRNIYSRFLNNTEFHVSVKRIKVLLLTLFMKFTEDVCTTVIQHKLSYK
jgi:hypothetical protein